jgi:hypothetical protein
VLDACPNSTDRASAAPPTVLFNVIIDDLGSAYFGAAGTPGKKAGPQNPITPKTTRWCPPFHRRKRGLAHPEPSREPDSSAARARAAGHHP